MTFARSPGWDLESEYTFGIPAELKPPVERRFHRQPRPCSQQGRTFFWLYPVEPDQNQPLMTQKCVEVVSISLLGDLELKNSADFR
jgi:hypothetical protein